MWYFAQGINNFYGPYGVYKQNIESLKRHLNASQQMMYAKKLANEKMNHHPQSIIINNHVHFIGKYIEIGTMPGRWSLEV